MHRKILLVEDDYELRETLKDVFELEAYEVITAANGKEALDVLRSGVGPCVIVLDMMMPVMNGWEFLEVRKREGLWDNIPVVAVTAASDTVSRLPNVQICFRKPLRVDVLIKMIEQCCNAA